MYPPAPTSNRLPPPIPTQTQAMQSTYASRLRTGATLLVQPIITAPAPGAPTTLITPSINAAPVASTSYAPGPSTTRTRRAGRAINYADPGSGDELDVDGDDDDTYPDAGALDSDDSDFVASGGTRAATRERDRSRAGIASGMSIFNSTTGVTTQGPAPPQPIRQISEKSEVDQSYLGQIPPSRFIKSRPFYAYPHSHPLPSASYFESARPPSLLPIRVEFETETHRVRDVFTWNIHEAHLTPEIFAAVFCNDLELAQIPYAEIVATQIRAQLEEGNEWGVGWATGVGGLGGDAVASGEADWELPTLGESSSSMGAATEISDCRVILSIDVQIFTYHLIDNIEWDLLSPLTPEAFAKQLCKELGLGGDAWALVSHAVHEELIKHKRDVVEWGVVDVGGNDDGNRSKMLKSLTGLGLPTYSRRDGRGPRPLHSVWRDWQDQEEYRTRFEELTPEEVEKREMERERASRRLRRETSKFQGTRSSRRR